METFEGLPLAIRAAKEGGTMPTVFNAANEALVAKFLQKKIAFLDIYEGIRGAMEHHRKREDPSLEEILDAEREAREWVERFL